MSFNSAEGVGWLGGLCTMKFPSWLPAYIVAAGGTNHTFMIKWHVGFHHSLYFFMWFNAKITSFWCNSHHGKLTGPLYKMTMATWYKKHLSNNAVESWSERILVFEWCFKLFVFLPNYITSHPVCCLCACPMWPFHAN